MHIQKGHIHKKKKKNAQNKTGEKKCNAPKTGDGALIN